MRFSLISPTRAFILTLLVLGSVGGPAGAALVPAGFTDQTLATGLTNASTMAFAPDGRLFIGQQAGLVRVVKNGALLTAPFVALTVNSGTDRGLLGITFDPGFSTNNFVYLSYTTTNSTPFQRVSRFTAAGDVAVAGSEMVLLDSDPFTATKEVGGALRFGPDGTLYIGMGQSGASSNAQSLGNVLGKILRINSDGSIPSDNPFFGTTTGKNRSIWALGLRNPFSFSFQPGTGRIFINDVGSSVAEEINDGLAGANYGWPTCEGNCSPANPSFRDPFYRYLRTPAANVITGGTFYNPDLTNFPTQFVGKYFFTDYLNRWIRVLDPLTTNVTEFATNLTSAVDLQVGPDGALYYLSRGGPGDVGTGVGAGSVGRIARELAVSLVPLRSTWRYLDNGANLSNAWRALTFDDSGWSNGPAQLGYGDGDEATVVGFGTNVNARYTNTYFRRAFVVPNASVFTNLIVRVLRDDGCVVYLNSNEIFRSNLPGGVITSTTFASIAAPDDGSVYFSTNVSPALLFNGTNFLAVEMHQSTANSSDLSFDLDLVGFVPAPQISAAVAPGTVELAWPFWATNYLLQTATVLPPAAWSTAASAVTLTNGQLRTTLSTSSNAQFFRLANPNP